MRPHRLARTLVAHGALIAVAAAPALAQGAPPAGTSADAPSPELARIIAQVEAAEAARLARDTTAWTLLAPGFLFVHSTGNVDDRAAYDAFRARGPQGSVRGGMPRRADVAPPVWRLDGDVLVRVRLLGDTAGPGIRGGQTRVSDVWVKRDGRWLWLAHQSGEVRARWATATADAAALDEYAGSWAAASGRARRVFARRGDGLVQLLDPAAGGGERRMIPLSDASFGYDGLNAVVTFVRDRSGKVVAADETSQVAFSRYVRAP